MLSSCASIFNMSLYAVIDSIWDLSDLGILVAAGTLLILLGTFLRRRYRAGEDTEILDILIAGEAAIPLKTEMNPLEEVAITYADMVQPQLLAEVHYPRTAVALNTYRETVAISEYTGARRSA